LKPESATGTPENHGRRKSDRIEIAKYGPFRLVQGFVLFEDQENAGSDVAKSVSSGIAGAAALCSDRTQTDHNVRATKSEIRSQKRIA
jgi:hypothetical protein